MKTPDRDPIDYPHKVLESTRLYVEELLQEISGLRREIATFEDDNFRLQQQVRELRMRMDSQRTEQRRTEDEKHQILNESEEQAARFAEIEKQNSDLANLYVASYQLHGTVDREEVLQAIREIVINLIGSEEFGLYELEGDRLSLVTSFGARAESTSQDEVRALGLERSLETGEVLVADGDSDGTLLASIPLRLGDRVVGGIAIFELLGHKPGLEHIDYELFDLLAAHAAPALYLAELHAGRGE